MVLITQRESGAYMQGARYLRTDGGGAQPDRGHAGGDRGPIAARFPRVQPAGAGRRAGRDPAALPGLVPGGGADLPRAQVGGAGRDRDDGIGQRPVPRARRAPRPEPQGRRRPDAVRAGHVPRVRGAGRPVGPAHPVRPEGRDLQRRPDAVRGRCPGRHAQGSARRDLRLQPRALVRPGRAGHRIPVHRGRPRAQPEGVPPGPAPRAPWAPVLAGPGPGPGGRPAVRVGQPASASAATSAVTAASTSTRAVSACVWARSRSPRAMQSKATRASCWAAWSSRAAWSSAGLFCSVSELVILGPSPVWRALALIGLGDRHVTRSEDCSPGATHETIPGTEEDAMCRLFGLTAGTTAVRTTFWLLDAPDSLEVQSHRNADGAGIGFFDAARAPVLDKQPEPAFADQEFIREARQASSATFVAHVRWASTGGRTVQNTHPFAMHGRIMAHNGGFGELALLEKQVGPYLALVQGDTDSERYFALIIKETEAHGGDVGGGVTAAGGGVAAHLPLSSLNTIVAAPGELWAFRYPAQHALHILERPAGTFRVEAGARGLHVRSATSSVHAPGLDSVPSVVLASGGLDGESGWRMLEPGELVHVRADLSIRSAVVLTEPPARLVPLPAGNPNIDT